MSVYGLSHFRGELKSYFHGLTFVKRDVKISLGYKNSKSWKILSVSYAEMIRGELILSESCVFSGVAF